MRKLCFLLAALLAFSGCGAAKPVDLPTASAEVSSVADGSSVPEPASSALPEMPAPDAPPVTAIGAIELPEPAFTSTAGYSMTMLTPAQYDANQDDGGLGGFAVGDLFVLGQGGKLALANANGKLITDFVYDTGGVALDPWRSSSGTYPMHQNGKTGLIDARTGEVAVPLQYDFARTLAGIDNSGLFLVEAGESQLVLDREGTIRFTLERGDDVFVLNGSIVLMQGEMLKFYDSKDYTPISNFSCDEMRIAAPLEEAEQLLAVNVDDKWGLCDARGKWIVQPIYEDIGYFGVGSDYAEFTKDGKKGVLRRDGKVVVKPIWDDLMVFQNSVSICKDNKWGAIRDIDGGEPAIQPMYDYVYGFGTDGLATYERGGKFGIIDREGNEIVAAHYDAMISSGNNLDKGYYLLDGDNGPYSAGVTGGGQLSLPTDHYFIPQGRYPIYAEDEPYNLVMTPRGKWGYVDGTGKFVIDAKFDEAEGFLAGKDIALVKQSDKICLIDRKGNIVLETVFSNIIGYNPETMVFAMEYTSETGDKKTCLAKINLPA